MRKVRKKEKKNDVTTSTDVVWQIEGNKLGGPFEIQLNFPEYSISYEPSVTNASSTTTKTVMTTNDNNNGGGDDIFWSVPVYLLPILLFI